MGRHSDGKMNWKISSQTWEGIRMRLVAAVVGFAIVVVLIVASELTGIGR